MVPSWGLYPVTLIFFSMARRKDPRVGLRLHVSLGEGGP